MSSNTPHPVPLSSLPSIETSSSTDAPPTSTIAPSSSPDRLPSPYPPYPHLLADYQHLPPLPDEKSPIDQKSYINPHSASASLSPYYNATFPEPFITGTVPSQYVPGAERLLPAWDIHIYFRVWNDSDAPAAENREENLRIKAEVEAETLYARHLWERIRREFPELRIYRLWERPIGPHTLPMFEVNLFTPAQYGAFIPWLAINRGPLSALVHPNTQRGAKWDHTIGAVWLGDKVVLNVDFL